MDATAFSIYAFGIYEVGAGFGFFIFPNKILAVLKIPTTHEPWIRVIGVLAILVGYYHILIGQLAINEFYYPSIYARLGFVIGLLLLVITKKARFSVLLFGVASFLSVFWTMMTLV